MVLFTEYVDWVVVQAKKKFNFDILAQLERARPDFHPLWELEMERQKIEHVVRKLPEAAVKSLKGAAKVDKTGEAKTGESKDDTKTDKDESTTKAAKRTPRKKPEGKEPDEGDNDKLTGPCCALHRARCIRCA
jgi:hypothetical protein